METVLLSQPSTPQAISSHESSPPLTNLRDLGVILTENNTTDHMDIEFDLDKLNARNRVNMRISYILYENLEKNKGGNYLLFFSIAEFLTS